LNDNPESFELLKEYPDRISWYNLSGNTADEAVELLRQNVDKIWWVLGQHVHSGGGVDEIQFI
jgi:hypothetical protein